MAAGEAAGAADAKRVQVFGLTVYSDDLAKVPFGEKCATISTISPNSYGMSTRDPQFRRALEEADYLVLDGVYFALSSIVLQGRTIRPNQGPNLFRHFMLRLEAIGGRAFFLGSSEQTLAKIRARSQAEFPHVAVGTYSPPFKAEFDAADNAEMIRRVDSFGPDVLFVGMTAPKQEKWAHANRDRISARLIVSVGAVFDWYAGNEKPIAPIWWKLKLGWLIRTIHRPAILRRYPNIMVFFWHLVLARLGLKKFHHGRS
jgi:N-acetylglucosaminyldiphosphoundecaprenol N-acetyl-beta-D-mannosaminyltransferase